MATGEADGKGTLVTVTTEDGPVLPSPLRSPVLLNVAAASPGGSGGDLRSEVRAYGERVASVMQAKVSRLEDEKHTLEGQVARLSQQLHLSKADGSASREKLGGAGGGVPPAVAERPRSSPQASPAKRAEKASPSLKATHPPLPPFRF